jgi:hypothetical protein
MANELRGVPVEASPFAPDVFADEALAFETAFGVVRITLAVAKMSEPVPPSTVKLVTIGRLVMGVEPAQRLAIGLFNCLKSQGVDLSASLGVDQSDRPH